MTGLQIFYLLSVVFSFFYYYSVRNTFNKKDAVFIFIPFLNFFLILMDIKENGKGRIIYSTYLHEEINKKKMLEKNFFVYRNEQERYDFLVELLEGLVYWKNDYWNPELEFFKPKKGYPWNDILEFSTPIEVFPGMVKKKIPLKSLEMIFEFPGKQREWRVDVGDVTRLFDFHFLDKILREEMQPILNEMILRPTVEKSRVLDKNSLMIKTTTELIHKNIQEKGKIEDAVERELIVDLEKLNKEFYEVCGIEKPEYNKDN